MKKLSLLLLTVCLMTGCAMAANCGWPYDCGGQVADTTIITAHGNGNIVGQFIGFDANFTDYVRVVDVTQEWTSGWLIQNQFEVTSPVFGIAKKGDVLVVQLCAVPDWLQDKSCHEDPDVRIFASDPSLSDDKTNHAYVYKGTPNPFVNIGMEDLAKDWKSDWDYNDLEFYLFNVDIAPGGNVGNFGATPEPASLLLLGSGLIAAVRKARKGKT
jgi:hypothetical protein